MPFSGDERFVTGNRTPAVLPQMCFQFAVRLNGEAPLSLVSRVTILADQHLLLTSEIVRIEPQRNGEGVAGEVCAILEFNQRLAIKHQALPGGPGGRLSSATHDQCVIDVFQRPVRGLDLRCLRCEDQKQKNRVFHADCLFHVS